MRFSLTITLLLILGSISITRAQNSLSIEEQLARLEQEMDSLSIFFLLDSILNEPLERYSELNPRISYNSNVLSLGRNYGLDQHGISPGVSFYHKSGIYADYTGFWSNNLDPRYSLSVASIGYLGSFNMNWSYSTSYERWVYHNGGAEDTVNPLKNSLGGSLSYNTAIGYASIDYSYLFGTNGGAHRLIGSLTGTINLGSWWLFDRITILPSYSTYFGNQEIIVRFDGDLLEELRLNEYLRQNFDTKTLESLLSEAELQQIEMIRQRSNGSPSGFQRLRILDIYLSNPDVLNYLYDLLDEEINQYGFMNHSFSLPIMMTIRNFSFMVNYTYSIPVKLQGEEIKPNPVGYFGASISYRIPFR